MTEFPIWGWSPCKTLGSITEKNEEYNGAFSLVALAGKVIAHSGKAPAPIWFTIDIVDLALYMVLCKTRATVLLNLSEYCKNLPQSDQQITENPFLTWRTPVPSQSARKARPMQEKPKPRARTFQINQQAESSSNLRFRQLLDKQAPMLFRRIYKTFDCSMFHLFLGFQLRDAIG